MANRLKMATVQSILSLHARGWSQRRIARELGVDRESVARHLRLARESAPAARSDLANPESAIAPISGPGSVSPKPAKAPLEFAGWADSKPANAPIPATGPAALAPLLGSPSEAAASGRQSDREPWRESRGVLNVQSMGRRIAPSQRDSRRDAASTENCRRNAALFCDCHAGFHSRASAR
jgi:hypothetical protein